MDKKAVAGLLFIFLFAYFLRVVYLPSHVLTFGYDQARDAFIAGQILSGDIKILGPPTSTPGLFHGVFYYYLLAPAYLLGGGSPIVAAYWIAFFNALAIFAVFYLTYLFTKKLSASFLAAFLFAISFEAVQYATWLSNPTLAVWTVPLIYLGLWLWLNPSAVPKKIGRWGPVVTALGLGLSIQAEIFLFYHIAPIILWLLLARKRVEKKDLVKAIFVLALALSSMVLVELKFGFKGLSGVASLLSSEDIILQRRDLGDFIVLYLNQMGRTFSNTLFPSNLGYGGALGLFMFIFLIRDWVRTGRKEMLTWQPFLATYLLAHLPIVPLGGVSTPFLTVGLGAAATIMAGIAIARLWIKRKLLTGALLLIIFLSNISMLLTEGKKGQVIFAIQEDMRLSNELKVVDYTYQVADGKPFSINTLTSPLWVNTTWSYLYNWYGKENYGYLPEWRGRDQVGQLGNNLTVASKGTNLHFFIKEPPQGIPGIYQEQELASENARSSFVEEKAFGDLEVQQRTIEGSINE